MAAKSTVFKYFKISNEDQDLCICQVAIEDGNICSAKLNTKTSNLKRHLERKHINIFKLVKEADSESMHKRDSQDNGNSSSSSSTTQSSISKYLTCEKVTISMTKEKFQKCIIKMVVNNGVALQFFSSTAFLGLNGELASKLKVSLDRHDIRNMVIKEADDKKNVLKETLHGKFCYLKMDACTRHKVNYFAINVIFLDNNNVSTMHTLSVRNTQDQHTEEFMQNMVEEVLKEFEINKQHVLAVVTNNASNMTSLLEKLNLELDLTGADNDVSDEIIYLNTSMGNADDHESEISEETLDSAFNNRLIEFHHIEHMRCAVHTLQMAIHDGLKEKYVNTLIGKLRQVVVIARMPKVDAIVKRRKGKGAILDQATRWGSTYLMIQRLLEIKDTLIDMAHPEITLTESQWRQAKELEEILCQPFLVTKKLQAEDLTPGTFYKEWKELIFIFSQDSNIISDAIKASMMRQEKILLENRVLLAAIYVDPKYRIILNEEQLNRGKAALTDIAVRMHQGVVSSNLNIDGYEQELNFEKYLDNKAKRRRTERSSINSEISPLAKFKLDFISALNEVEKIDRLSISSKLKVMEVISLYPEIVQKAAYTVTSLPLTQVSVERLFSALPIICSDLRASMKDDLVEAILFLRANSF